VLRACMGLRLKNNDLKMCDLKMQFENAIFKTVDKSFVKLMFSKNTHPCQWFEKADFFDIFKS